MDVLAEAFQQQEAAAANLQAGAAASGFLQDPLAGEVALASGGVSTSLTCLTCQSGTVHIPNPAFDYIPPHLISLFITDTGAQDNLRAVRVYTAHVR